MKANAKGHPVNCSGVHWVRVAAGNAYLPPKRRSYEHMCEGLDLCLVYSRAAGPSQYSR